MKELNLTALTVDELKDLIQEANAELQNRATKTDLVVYTHDCKDCSNYHLGKYKHWAKLVTAIDVTKTNGYAFIGDFLSVIKEHKIPAGSIVVEVCGDDIEAYKVGQDGKTQISKARTNAMSALIENLAQIIGA